MQKHNQIKLLLKDNSGSALIMAVVFCAVFLIMGTGTIKLISRGNELYTREVEVIKSFWTNESALKIALRYLTRENPSPTTTIDDLNAGLSPEIDINGYKPSVLIYAKGNRRYDITVRTAVDNLKNETAISEASFYTFSRWTEFERCGETWHKFIVNGTLHANETLTLSRGMTDEVHVTGLATCAGTHIGGYPEEYYKGLKVDGGSSPGLAWFRRRLPYYQSVDYIPTDNLAPEEGAFDEGWNIEFETKTNYQQYLLEMKVINDNGKVNIYGLQNGNDWVPVTGFPVSDIYGSNSGIIISEKPIHVAGKLKGQLTIVSHDDIYLAGDIHYDGVTPGELPDLDDLNLCGIVSGDDIFVKGDYSIYDDPDLSDFQHGDWNSGKLDLYASLFASKGGFVNYGTIPGREKYVNIYGSYLCDWQPGTPGYTLVFTGDERYMQNIASPPGIPSPQAQDREMRDHWSRPMAMSFPISIPQTWNNYMAKL